MAIRPKKLERFIYSAVTEFFAHRKVQNEACDSFSMISSFCNAKGIELVNCILPQKPEGKVGGSTDGKSISIDFTDNHGLNHFLFWHEYAHYHLHFDRAGSRLTLKEKEQEADIFATYMCDLLFPGHYDDWIKFAHENPHAQ